MISPNLPLNEVQRLGAVHEYQLVDTLPESDYDNITKLVSTICDVPIALISILDSDRNFFKSHHGIAFNNSPRDISFCGHTILQDEPIFIVNDARIDPRFHDNPLLSEQKTIFYAGVSLINPEGFPIGTICVFDHKPRELNDGQKEALIILGKQVENLFELRRSNIKLKKAKSDLQERNEKLKSFASHVSHDLKSPLANISSLTQLLREENTGNLSQESLEYMNYIDESTSVLKDYIDGLLLYYKADDLLKAKKEKIEFRQLFKEIQHTLIMKNDTLSYPLYGSIDNINKPALSHILMNLVDNGLKYNTNAIRKVHVEYLEDGDFHQFSVTDNGIGIAKIKQKQIFKLFKTLNTDESNINTGIGLSAVKNLVNKLGGRISVHSELDKGSTFTFTLKK